MIEKIKSKKFLIFKILIAIVLIAQFSNLIFNYNDEIIKTIDTVMFSLIGISYLVFAWAVDNKILKLILLICGIYLIVMNFLEYSILMRVIAIICIITPMIIGKFQYAETDDEKSLVE